jgi:uncharacterized membrane protein
VALSPSEKERVEAKIAGAEALTSAEIKVIITGKSRLSIQHRARELFKKYGMHRTRDRNGVLILLALDSRKVLVHGDEQVHARVGQAFWDEVIDAMRDLFREGQLCEGLCLGVHLLGERLAELFPPLPDDTNEISNEVIIDV